MKLTQTVKKFGSFDAMNKQIRFATAVALTKTAKDAQGAVRGALADNFTLRTNWSDPANKIGVKVTPAKKDKLEAQIRTLAEFLKKFDEGIDKTPRGKRIAIPTENVRRNKKMLIPKAQRPAALRNKRTFVIETKSGPILFQRKFKGKRSKIVALYNLETMARIKKTPVWREPIEKAVRANFHKHWEAAVKQAFATAK